MLKRKFMLFTIAVTVMSMAFAAGNDADILAKLPKSGARKFVTNQEQMMMAGEACLNGMNNDEGLTELIISLDNTDLSNITPDFNQIGENLVTQWQNYTDSLEGKNPVFNRTGKLNVAINQPVGNLGGLPAGLNLYISDIVINSNAVCNKNSGKGVLNLSTSAGYDFSLDTKKIMGSAASSSMLKGLVSDCMIDAKVSVNFESYATDYADFFNSADENSLSSKGDSKMSLRLGASINTIEGIGGKVVVDVSSAYKGSMNPDEMQKYSNAMENFLQTMDTSAFVDFPADVHISLKFYNDNNVLTYTAYEANSLEEYMQLLQMLMMLTNY